MVRGMDGKREKSVWGMGTEERWRDSQQGDGHVWDPGAGLGVGACWWRCRLPAAADSGLWRKALPARRRGPDSGRDGSLGPRGPRDPPPGMR